VGQVSPPAFDIEPRTRGWGAKVSAVLAVGVLAAGGCQKPGRAPPFEWWAEPLPEPQPARSSGRLVKLVVLVEHTGRRDDFGQFQRTVASQHARVRRGEIAGFRSECHYLPALAERTRDDLAERLNSSGWFLVVERKLVDKALKDQGLRWLDLRTPETAARLGQVCDAEGVLLVEITECTMTVVEAGRQTIGAQKTGPVRRTDVTVRYDLRVVDVAGAKVSWQSDLTRRCGYKLEGAGSMGHWYRPRDPLEFLEALRGRGLVDYVLRAFEPRRPDSRSSPQSPAEAWRW